jgi:hypothetical protein
MSSSVFPVPFSGIQETKLTTTGDTLYASAANTAARLGVGSTNQVLGVTGGIPAWQASSKSTLTTTGDTMYASGANTPARLGIGTAGQVLTVNSGATAPEWATVSTGWTNLTTSTAFGSVSSVTLSSINQTYKDLRLVITGWSSATGGGVQIAFNDANTAYGGLYVDYTGTFVVARTNNGRAYFRMGDSLYQTAAGDYVIELPFYSSTNNKKFGQGIFSGQDGGSGADAAGIFNFYKTNNSAISSITLSSSGGNFDAGSYELWGKK